MIHNALAGRSHPTAKRACEVGSVRIPTLKTNIQGRWREEGEGGVPTSLQQLCTSQPTFLPTQYQPSQHSHAYLTPLPFLPLLACNIIFAFFLTRCTIDHVLTNLPPQPSQFNPPFINSQTSINHTCEATTVNMCQLHIRVCNFDQECGVSHL